MFNPSLKQEALENLPPQITLLYFSLVWRNFILLELSQRHAPVISILKLLAGGHHAFLSLRSFFRKGVCK